VVGVSLNPNTPLDPHTRHPGLDPGSLEDTQTKAGLPQHFEKASPTTDLPFSSVGTTFGKAQETDSSKAQTVSALHDVTGALRASAQV